MPAKKKRTRKRRTSKTAARPKARATKTVKAARKPLRKTKRISGRAFSREQPGGGAGGQSGDLQGLSRREDVDSESVEELIEEGNAFEAGVVQGVEDAEDSTEKEIRTREVPEDDVPGEYLDKDS